MRSWADELDRTPLAPVALVKPGTVGPAKPAAGLVYQRMYEWVSYPTEAPMQKYRDDPNDPEEHIKERPAPWWSPRSIGFRAKILVNPLGGELRVRDRKFAYWLRGEGTEKDYLEAIAEAVVEWDYVIVDENGERTPIAAPAVGGWERFLDLPPEAHTWLTNEIQSAHLPKVPKSPTPTMKPVTNTDEPTPTPDTPEPERPESS